MTQHLIGIAGPKGSGKNTVAEFIKDAALLQGQSFIELSFAAKMKAAAARSLGFQGTEDALVSLMNECKTGWQFKVTAYDNPDDGMYGDPERLNARHVALFSGREYLQWFGTEGGRGTYGDDFWVDAVLPNPIDFAAGGGWVDSVPTEMLARRYPQDFIVITDARFENEARRIKALGGTMWEVTRPGYGEDGHPSEAALPRELVDLTLENVGERADLGVLVELGLMSL